MLKDLLSLPALMRHASTLTGRMQEVTERLKSERYAGTSGGSLVKVEVNGAGEVLKVEIDARLIQRQEKEMIEDLLPAAVNQALEKSRQAHMKAMQELGEGLDIPGLQQALGRVLGGSS